MAAFGRRLHFIIVTLFDVPDIFMSLQIILSEKLNESVFAKNMIHRFWKNGHIAFSIFERKLCKERADSIVTPNFIILVHVF